MTRQFVLPGLNRSVANADQLTQPCLHHEECAIGTAAWVWPQVMNATPWGRQPRYLIHDRDAVYGPDFGAKPAGLGIASIRTPIRALRRTRLPSGLSGRTPGMPGPRGRAEREAPPRRALRVPAALQPRSPSPDQPPGHAGYPSSDTHRSRSLSPGSGRAEPRLRTGRLEPGWNSAPLQHPAGACRHP